MSDRQTVFVPIGTLAIALPVVRNGILVGSELVWLKPIWGPGRPWMGKSKRFPIDVVHAINPHDLEQMIDSDELEAVPEPEQLIAEPAPEPEPVPMPASRWERWKQIVGMGLLLGLIRCRMLPDHVFGQGVT